MRRIHGTTSVDHSTFAQNLFDLATFNRFYYYQHRLGDIQSFWNHSIEWSVTQMLFAKKFLPLKFECYSVMKLASSQGKSMDSGIMIRYQIDRKSEQSQSRPQPNVIQVNVDRLMDVVLNTFGSKLVKKWGTSFKTFNPIKLAIDVLDLLG